MNAEEIMPVLDKLEYSLDLLALKVELLVETKDFYKSENERLESENENLKAVLRDGIDKLRLARHHSLSVKTIDIINEVQRSMKSALRNPITPEQSRKGERNE